MDTEYEPSFVHQQGAERANTYMAIESTRFAPLLVALSTVGLFVAGLALGVAFWALGEAGRAQQRADLAQLEVESFKNVLHAAHLPTSAHLPGESP
jgi:hypothetical protein